MDLTPCEEFLLEDSSSDDDSDVETLLANHRQQMVVVVLAVKEWEEKYRKKKRQGSKVGRLCIPHNRQLRHEMLMQDYFAEKPTYPPHLFRRRYRMRRSLFVRIVEACEANCRFFTRRRNAAGLIGGDLNKMEDEDDEDDEAEGGRNKNKPDGTKKAKEKIQRDAEASSLRDKIDNMVKSNELMVAKTLEAKRVLKEKKAQEKLEKWQHAKAEGLRKAAIEEKRALAEENKALAKLLAEENKIMMMNRAEMDEVTKEWHDMARKDILERRRRASNINGDE